jgi:hypothetical protein
MAINKQITLMLLPGIVEQLFQLAVIGTIGQRNALLDLVGW